MPPLPRSIILMPSFLSFMNKFLPFLLLLPLSTLSAQSGWVEATDNSASKGAFLTSSETGTNEDLSPDRELTYTFSVTGSATRYLWVRYRTQGTGGGTVYAALNEQSQTLTALAGSQSWAWAILLQADLQDGENQLRILRHSDNVELDRFYAALDPKAFPLGKGAHVAEFGPGLTFPQWAASRTWPTPGTDDLPTADFDLDGIDNLMEYLWGTDPQQATGELFRVNSGGSSEITLYFPRSKAASNLIIRILRSEDLSTWNEIAAGETSIVGENEDQEFVSVTIPRQEGWSESQYFTLAAGGEF